MVTMKVWNLYVCVFWRLTLVYGLSDTWNEWMSGDCKKIFVVINTMHGWQSRRGGGRGGVPTTTRSGKTIQKLNEQRTDRSEILIQLLENSSMVRTILNNSITAGGYRFYVAGGKRPICSYDYQIFDLAETLIREYRPLTTPRYRKAYESLGLILLNQSINQSLQFILPT